MITLARNRRLGLGMAALTALLDQASKAWVLGPLQLPAVHLLRVAADPATPDLPLLPVFGFTFTQNFGVSLGLLTAGSEVQRWALVGLTAAIALMVALWLWRERQLGDIAALGLVLGGAAGNIADRAGRGYVVDFLDLHFGAYRPFLIFNLADAAITVGVLIVLARSFLSRDKRPNPAGGELTQDA